MLIFSEIYAFIFYKKNVPTVRNSGMYIFPYTLLYYSLIHKIKKSNLFVILFVTKRSAFYPRLDRMHLTQTKQTNNKTLFQGKYRFIKGCYM